MPNPPGRRRYKSVELKEERIRVLEDRLQDALTQNGQLKEDIGMYVTHLPESPPPPPPPPTRPPRRPRYP